MSCWHSHNKAGTTKFKEVYFHHQKLYIKTPFAHLLGPKSQHKEVPGLVGRIGFVLVFSARISNGPENLAHLLDISIVKL